MLWTCTCGGLAILTHWQTYAAALLFLIVSMGSKSLSDALTGSSTDARTPARLGSRLLLALGQVAGIAIFVDIMCPLLLGLSVHAAWSWPPFGLASSWDVMKAFAGLVLIATIVSRIPILGQFPSLSVFVIGSLTLVPALEMLDKRSSGLTQHHIQFWPGFWFMAALFSTGAVLTWLGTMIAVIPSTLLKGQARRIGSLLAYPLAAAFGFIPLYMYCAWLRHQIGTS